MLLRFSALAALLLLLTACAAAVPGYTPPSFKGKSKHSTAMESGNVGEDRRYRMSEQEKAMDCKRMTGSMQITIARLRDVYYRTSPSGIASAGHKVVPYIAGGSTVGSDREAEYARERAKLDAYNEHLRSKDCKTLDIEAEFKRAPEPMDKKY